MPCEPSILDLLPVLFELGPVSRCESLGNAGGFSGAAFWRLWGDEGRCFCLRRWPPGSDLERVRWIHQVVTHASSIGCTWLAAPLSTASGETWFEQGDQLFELAPWMPGSADFHQHPTRSRLRHALQALAQFHMAARSHCSPTPVDTPPAVHVRLQRFRELRLGKADEIRRQLHEPHPLVDAETGQLIMDCYDRRAAAVERSLLAVDRAAMISPCLRDIWHDHLLFTGEVVTGIVDYDAMRLDVVATDISRLVGSLVGGDATRWPLALDAYAEVAPLDACQREWIEGLDASNVVLAGMQWLEWLCVRKITFENAVNVRLRLASIRGRLMESGFPG